MDLRFKGETLRTVRAEKASGTVIEAGDLVALDSSGLVIKATATDTKIAWCPNGAASGTTDVEITIGNDFMLSGTGDVVFAKAHRGIDCDLVISSTVQKIDLGENTTEVFSVHPGVDAGTVGSASNILVKIKNPIF